MIRHDIVGVRKEKVILIVTGPFPFGLITRYTQEMSAFGLLRQPQVMLAELGLDMISSLTQRGDARQNTVSFSVPFGLCVHNSGVTV